MATKASTFTVPAKAQGGDFSFTIPGVDRELAVPLLRKLPAHTIALLQSDESGITAFIELFDGEDRAEVGALDLDQLEALIAAWRDASGITEGESSASGS